MNSTNIMSQLVLWYQDEICYKNKSKIKQTIFSLDLLPSELDLEMDNE